MKNAPFLATTSSSTSTSSATTTQRPMCSVTRPGDPTHGLYNTIAGGNTGGFEGRYPTSNEVPAKAIDNDVNTKYVNFGTTSVMNANVSQPGANTGFYVTPQMANVSVVNGIRFATGNDYEARDPLTMTLEGTNSTALNTSSIWTLLYNGSTGIDAVNAPNRTAYGVIQVFPNTVIYRSYRLLITSQRSYQDSVQYSEFQILSYC